MKRVFAMVTGLSRDRSIMSYYWCNRVNKFIVEKDNKIVGFLDDEAAASSVASINYAKDTRTDGQLLGCIIGEF